jgi:hypothetical protein
MKTPDLKGGQMLTIAYFIAIVVVLFIVYKFLGKIGLIKTADKKKQDEAETKAAQTLRTSVYFDPMYLKGKTKTYNQLGNDAQYYAATIMKALGGFGTDEELIYATFGKLKSKENIAEVAAYYLQDYNRILQADLLNDLSDEEMVILNDIISKLPNK